MCRGADRYGTEAPYIVQPLVSTRGRQLSLEVMSCSLQAVLGRAEKARVWINGKKPACFIG